jgi:O-antigen ligase
MFINFGLLFLLPYYYANEKISLKKFCIYLNLAVIFISLYQIFTKAVIGDYLLLGGVISDMKLLQSFSTFLMMSLFLSMFSFMVSENLKEFFICAVACLLAMTALLLSLSRSSWFALAVLLPIFFVFAVLILRRRGALIRIVILIMMLIMVFSLGHLFKETRGEGRSFKILLNTQREFVNPDPNILLVKNKFVRNLYYFIGHQRTTTWRQAIEIFANSPFKGYGINYNCRESVYPLHNTFLSVLMAAGILGFIFFSLFVISIFLALTKKIKTQVLEVRKMFLFSLFFSLAAWLFQGLAQTIINEYIIWLVLSLVFLKPESFSFEGFS